MKLVKLYGVKEYKDKRRFTMQEMADFFDKNVCVIRYRMVEAPDTFRVAVFRTGKPKFVEIK